MDGQPKRMAIIASKGALEFIDGIEFGGAATFLGFAGKSDITLFI